MTNTLPTKSVGDHLHLAARAAISAIPTVGGPILEFFNAIVNPPIERRRNDWINELATRIQTLELEKRLKADELSKNEEFISAVLQATASAIRNHHRDKLDALRNAVVNSALGRGPAAVKAEMFLAFVDQFTVLHLKVLHELAKPERGQCEDTAPKVDIASIARIATKRVSELQQHQRLAEHIVEDLCRKGLVYWGSGPGVTYVPNGTRQVTELGEEFLDFVSDPNGVSQG